LDHRIQNEFNHIFYLSKDKTFLFLLFLLFLISYLYFCAFSSYCSLLVRIVGLILAVGTHISCVIDEKCEPEV